MTEQDKHIVGLTIAQGLAALDEMTADLEAQNKVIQSDRTIRALHYLGLAHEELQAAMSDVASTPVPPVVEAPAPQVEVTAEAEVAPPTAEVEPHTEGSM